MLVSSVGGICFPPFGLIDGNFLEEQRCSGESSDLELREVFVVFELWCQGRSHDYECEAEERAKCSELPLSCRLCFEAVSGDV